jgi:hypothetical protein
LTLVGEGWPLRRLGRIPSGPVALAVAWSIALTLYLLLVKTDPKPGSGLDARTGGLLSGAEFGAVLTAIGLWQVWFYVALRGWPFSAIAFHALGCPARSPCSPIRPVGRVRHHKNGSPTPVSMGSA